MNDKNKFIRNEFLTLSLLGALARSNTYLKNTPENVRQNLRETMRTKLDKLARQYEVQISGEVHLTNIEEFANEMSTEFSQYLNNGRFRIGIAQKAINLFLKYLWCADIIPQPPHCPFDGIIISRLPGCEDVKWSKIDKIEEYKRLVVATKQKAKDKSLAVWELIEWNSKSAEEID